MGILVRVAVCTVAVCTVAVCTVAVCTVAVCTVAMCTVVVCTVAVCTVAVCTVVVCTVVVCHQKRFGPFRVIACRATHGAFPREDPRANARRSAGHLGNCTLAFFG